MVDHIDLHAWAYSHPTPQTALIRDWSVSVDGQSNPSAAGTSCNNNLEGETEAVQPGATTL